ncbi:hypothetical protein K501DRAFT_337071 [Backusella circina FSU 941]|nr:hypothetical protein K501DRAFT_337071 [Backusella circina FSU 941]
MTSIEATSNSFTNNNNGKSTQQKTVGETGSTTSKQKRNSSGSTDRSSDIQKKPLSKTDPKSAKEKQAKEKLEILATFREIQNGKLPHNDKLDELLEKLMNNTIVSSREHKMSQDGKLLLSDFRQLLQTLRNALQVKNHDELFQSYVHHLYLMELPIKKEHVSGSVDASQKDATKEEGKKNYQAFIKIGKLLILNNEFRSLLGELIDLSQNVFSNVTGHFADSLRNAGDNLEETSSKTHDRSGKEYVDDLLVGDKQRKSQDEVEEPHLIDSRAKDPQHAGLLNTGDSVHPDLLPMSNKKEGNDLRLDSKTDQNTLANTNPHGTSSNVIEESKDTVKKHAGKHKEHFTKNVKDTFNKDKQDELLDRLRKAVGQIQSHPEYQDATTTIIDLCKEWTKRLTTVSSNIKDKSSKETEQIQIRKQAQSELKTIIETWGQGKSLDPVLNALKDVGRDAKEDEELRSYYHDSLNYVERLINEPDYINKSESTRDGRQLTDKGRELMKGKYGDHFNHLSKLVRGYLKDMSQDETAREINQCVTKIHQDLWMDSEGNPAFKPHLLNDMRMTLLPAFLDEIRYIPVPRVEYSDKQYDVTIDDLVISGDTLLPNIFETKMENFYSFNLKQQQDDDDKHSHQTLYIRMSEIQATIDDVNFSYKKKTGFPKISDRGTASVHVDGKGITVTLRIQSASDSDHTFKVSNLKCNVDNIKIRVSESNHDILYKAIRPIVTGIIRKQVARAIENKVRLALESLDRRITTSIINMNQSLQEKAYAALPESERMNAPSNDAAIKPGFFSTVVTIINRNIKTKVENRNNNKRQKSIRSTPSKRRSFFSLDRKASGSDNSKQVEIASPSTMEDQPAEVPHINGDQTHDANEKEGLSTVGERPNIEERPSFKTPGQSVTSHNSLPGSFPKVNKRETVENTNPPPAPTHRSRDENSQRL